MGYHYEFLRMPFEMMNLRATLTCVVKMLIWCVLGYRTYEVRMILRREFNILLKVAVTSRPALVQISEVEFSNCATFTVEHHPMGKIPLV
ncbi:hypothetical protein PoB_001789500 [Plakobranchus ocellatus]|uniref:Uncharacterized protein n=1 Tax=Plakobranchus ocellatus TaxID=259542 RepID=A0AAV3ZA30_9GAST|nr:hypothetical protein PoB_001789500 [Plakobranchus ocellatus]